ncbi:MAG: hypothetical protein ACE5G2_01555 [Candidatus Krumholzibacteriia bacterium]
MHLRFIQDDAFISFCYARNLVEGEGLTWFGARVEGYTNFLWVLWIALGILVGVDPTAWAQGGGIASFLVVILTTWLLARRVFREPLLAGVAVLLLVTNYTTISYATGGMETMAQTALICAAMWQVYELWATTRPSRLRLSALSTLLALAILARPDSLLPGAILGTVACVDLIRKRSHWGRYAALALPLLLLVGPWVSWKLIYYGRVLPNTYYVKVPGGFNPNGVVHAWRFVHWYLFWPILLIGIPVRLFVPSVPRFCLWPLWCVISAWTLYVVSIGGDFMEFRMFVPIAPFLFICLAYLIYLPVSLLRLRAGVPAAAMLLLLLVGASYHHATTFEGTTEDDALDSIESLSTFYGLYADGNWDMVGGTLRREMGGTDAIIGLFAVGAIPFYSGLTTVDMYGLNDREIPFEGDKLDLESRRPGHRVQAKLSDLRERGVNLVIGHPRLVQRNLLRQPGSAALCRRFVRSMVSAKTKGIGDALVVSMPVTGRFGLLMWYLTPHPQVEERIRGGQWEARRVRVDR